MNELFIPLAIVVILIPTFAVLLAMMRDKTDYGPMKTGVTPHFDENGVYIDKFGSRCVRGECRPPQVSCCATNRAVKEAREILRDK